MNGQGSGNWTYFILLPDVKTGSECPGVGNYNVGNLRWPWGGDLDTGKSGLSDSPSPARPSAPAA